MNRFVQSLRAAKLHPLVLGLAVLALSLGSRSAAADGAPILPAPTRVSEHVYAWFGAHGGPSAENRGFRMNLAFVVGKDAVAVIETGYGHTMAQEMLAHIARVTPKPIKFAISSSSQPDRFLGNDAFRARGAQVLATPAEAERMAAMGGLFAQFTESALGLPAKTLRAPAAPDRLIDRVTEISLGGVTLRLHPVAAAHTPGPLVVHVVEDRVVYGGDVLYAGRLPAIIEGGNLSSWITVYDSLRQFGDVTFLPGHGRLGKLAAFDFSTRAYLALLHEAMKPMAEQGVGLVDAVTRLDQSRFAVLANYEDLAKRNANQAYREAEAEALK